MDNKSKIMSQYDSNKNIYQRFTSEVEHLLKILISEENISYNAITCRLKDRDSLSEKIDKKCGKYNGLKDITDIAGVRVITYYAEDVDKVADIVEHEFNVDKNNSIDKRKALEPDRFGYCSVHYVVELNEDRLKLKEYKLFSGMKCEIQIRSVLQHAWAEIEHDLGYKRPIAIPKTIRRSFSRLAGLLEIADKEFQNIRQSLSTYESQISEHIENDKDIEIDAVLLCELVKTNPDIIAINDKIEKIAGIDFEANIEPFDFEDSVSELHWLKIYTLDQLYKLVQKNGDFAVKIAEKFFSDEPFENDSEDISAIRRNIVFFYLCYAELVLNEEAYDINSCHEYLTCHHIGSYGDETTYEVAEELMAIRETFNKSLVKI